MIVDGQQAKWAAASANIAGALAVVYAAYAVLSTNGPRGGTPAGLMFASLGTGIIVFECLLGLRKRYPASRLGRLKTWLRAHCWLGLLSFLLIVFHSGFRWGNGLAAVLMWLFTIVVVSGILGVALQNYLPRRMTELVARETLFEQIGRVVNELRTEGDERIEFLTADLGLEEPEQDFVRAGGVKQYFDPEQKKSAAEKVQAVVERRKASPQIAMEENSREALRAHYLQEIRPYLTERPPALSRRLFGDRERVAAYFERLRIIMPVAAHEVLRDMEEICEERRQLAVQRRLHLWLHTWLVVHVPLSYGLLALTAVHAVLSLRY
jgi:hypothetical protein